MKLLIIIGIFLFAAYVVIMFLLGCHEVTNYDRSVEDACQEEYLKKWKEKHDGK